MFADDTQINTSSNTIDSIANILNEDLINVSDWMKANKLSLNSLNTWLSVLIKGFTKLKVIQIKRVKVTKSLGLMIDETVTWDEQVILSTKKVNKGDEIFSRD